MQQPESRVGKKSIIEREHARSRLKVLIVTKFLGNVWSKMERRREGAEGS